MIKFFKFKVPKYFTSHSKPERLSKYFAKEETTNRMENKFKNKRVLKSSDLKTLKGGIENYEKHN